MRYYPLTASRSLRGVVVRLFIFRRFNTTDITDVMLLLRPSAVSLVARVAHEVCYILTWGLEGGGEKEKNSLFVPRIRLSNVPRVLY